jgi:hypothetical protein
LSLAGPPAVRQEQPIYRLRAPSCSVGVSPDTVTLMDLEEFRRYGHALVDWLAD